MKKTLTSLALAVTFLGLSGCEPTNPVNDKIEEAYSLSVQINQDNLREFNINVEGKEVKARTYLPEFNYENGLSYQIGNTKAIIRKNGEVRVYNSGQLINDSLAKEAAKQFGSNVLYSLIETQKQIILNNQSNALRSVDNDLNIMRDSGTNSTVSETK